MFDDQLRAAAEKLYGPVGSATDVEIQGAAHAIARRNQVLFDELVAGLERMRAGARGAKPRRIELEGIDRLAGVVRLADVAPEETRWLWPGRIPMGKLSVLDGDPNVGKSTVCLDLAARVSTGSSLPEQLQGNDPRGVVILTAEDGLADTVRPRLEAAGGDPSRVVALQGVPTHVTGDFPVLRLPSIPQDLDLLHEVITQEDAALVIVDPLNAYLSNRIDGYRDQDVRSGLAPFAQLAADTGAAVVLVRHLTKQRGAPALYRGGGSIGIIGAARSGLLLAPDPEDESLLVLASTKSNLAAMPPSLALRRVDAVEFGCARIEWLGETDLSADDLLESGEGGRPDVREWLRDLLMSEGPMEAQVVVARARNEINAARRTVYRAANKIGVNRERQSVSGGPSIWSIGPAVPLSDGTTLVAQALSQAETEGVVPRSNRTTPSSRTEVLICPRCGKQDCRHPERACLALRTGGISFADVEANDTTNDDA